MSDVDWNYIELSNHDLFGGNVSYFLITSSIWISPRLPSSKNYLHTKIWTIFLGCCRVFKKLFWFAMNFSLKCRFVKNCKLQNNCMCLNRLNIMYVLGGPPKLGVKVVWTWHRIKMVIISLQLFSFFLYFMKLFGGFLAWQ